MHLPVAAAIEPIPPPDIRRPERTPSWPAWVALRLGSLKEEFQPDETGRHRRMPTLPRDLILMGAQREAIRRHLADLDKLEVPTPEFDPDAEAATLVIVTKIMLVLPAQRQNEASAEARGEAYMAALDDVPTWAVAAAARRWYRGDPGNDEHGKPYDCSWCPAPADLRRVAMKEIVGIRYRAKQLRQLIAARPRVEYSEEHCAAMRAQLRDLFKSLGTSPVGKNGSGEAAGLASAERATVGRDQSTAPA
jgi:hypothetical protein